MKNFIWLRTCFAALTGAIALSSGSLAASVSLNDLKKDLLEMEEMMQRMKIKYALESTCASSNTLEDCFTTHNMEIFINSANTLVQTVAQLNDQLITLQVNNDIFTSNNAEIRIYNPGITIADPLPVNTVQIYPPQ